MGVGRLRDQGCKHVDWRVFFVFGIAGGCLLKECVCDHNEPRSGSCLSAFSGG